MAGRSTTQERRVAVGLLAVGVAGWLHWTITDPTFDVSDAQDEWLYVIAFSGLIVALAVGAAALARTISPAAAVRSTTVVLLAAAVAGALTNVVEDGFGVEGAFVVFALSTGAQLLSLLALAVALTMRVTGTRRVLALAPLASAVGTVAYVPAGGPILLATWWTAAAVLVLTGREPTMRTSHAGGRVES